MANLNFVGLKDGGTFRVGATMKAAIASDLAKGVGKVVTLTGDGEVDYGTEGKFVFGVVDMVEKEDSNGDNLVATVLWNRTFDGIKGEGAETAGDPLVVDGKGGVKKATEVTDTALTAFVISGEGDDNTCIIRVV